MRLTGFSALQGVPRKSTFAAALASLLLLATPFTGSADPGSADSGHADPGHASPPPAAEEATVHALAVLDDVTEALAPSQAQQERSSAPEAPAPHLSAQLAELVSVYDDLPGPEQRAADRLLARPTRGTDPLGFVDYGNRSVTSTCNARICVHRVTEGKHRATASWAATVLAEVDRAWAVEVGQLGYRRPASDGGVGNPSGVSGTRLDVYLGEVSDHGLYGYAATDNPVTGATYLILDNDYANFPVNPLDAIRVTAAHEFFHALQYGYRNDVGPWFMETTAGWIEEQVHDEINDNLQYLRSENPLTDPGRSLDALNGNVYGGWIFFEHLSQRHGPTVVRDMWTRVGNGASHLKAIKKTLKARGTSLRIEFARFAASNTLPGKTYAEGRFYPRAKPAKKPKLGKKRRATGWHARRVDHLAATTVRFRPDGKLGKKWRIKATVKGPSRLQAELIVLRKNGKLIRKQVKVTGGKKIISTNFSTRKVRWVAVTVANTSTKSKHDNTVIRVKGRLKKK